MMAEQLWRRAKLTESSPQDLWDNEHWMKDEFDTLVDYGYLFPVPAGALLIEDGEEAAVGRVTAQLLLAFDMADEGLRAISSGRFGFRPETAWVKELAAKAVRAAVGGV